LIGSVAPARAARPSGRPSTLRAALPDSIALPFLPEPGLRAAAHHRRLTASVFIAHKLQLPGPVPAALRLPFVGYQPWMAWMFDKAGVRGALLNRLLHKQHRTVYSYDRHTRAGVILEPARVCRS
jgi:hypothetical protein